MNSLDSSLDLGVNSLEFFRSTLKYAVLKEAGRYKLAVMASRKALKFEERMGICKKGSIKRNVGSYGQGEARNGI